MVVLAATSAQLHELCAKLTAAGIPHAPVIEVDPPYTNELLAIGIPPGPKSRVRRFLSALPKLGKPRKEGAKAA